MTSELQELVRDTIGFTGSAPPAMLSEQAPILTGDALADGNFYLVGMIGGKDVGKSALVNALIGQPITASTAYGPGTETIVAYAHESQHDNLKQLLDREFPGQFQIVTHRLGQLNRQVLLDLPDIDSLWLAHAQITRKILRHLLFPLWIQSIEKYADQAPQNLLAQVAQGNSAANFIFCLNKTDQLSSPAAIDELKADYSSRISRLLKIPLPKVWMLSAVRPGEFDLPALQAMLQREKSTDAVAQSQQMALKQQDRSLADWLDSQDLTGRADRLGRLLQLAQETLSDRVGVPLLEQALPALADDPASRFALTDEFLSARVARWPMVNLIQTLMSPILAVVRRNVGVTRSASLPDAEALVQAHLQSGGVPLANLLRGAFAQLQQANPQISELYRDRKLWEPMAADLAILQLRAALVETVSRQRDLIRQRAVGRFAFLGAPFRWLLTIGALVWFPFLQPIAQTVLIDGPTHSTHDILLLIVRIFSVNALLQNLTFLAAYFFLLWIILRWDTHRRIARFARRWKSDASDLSLTAQAVRWLDDLLEPLHQAQERAQSLAQRAGALTAPPE